MTIRISTFNCENLFSRPESLNYQTNSDAAGDLAKAAKLDTLLAKAKYTETDKARILESLDELKGLVELNEMRQKLLGKHGGKTIVKVNGRDDWVGGLEFCRDPLSVVAQENTAKVIEAVDADIQCVIEVEDRLTLERFSQTLLKKKPFDYNIVIDGNDSRGIDVGILSRHPFGSIKTHVFDKEDVAKKARIFSRDCLEVEVLLPGDRSVFLLVNHLKSQGYGSKASNDARRKLQADRIVEILSAYDLRPGSRRHRWRLQRQAWQRTARGPVGARRSERRACEAVRRGCAKDRWTYKDKSQIDYLLVSKPLADAMIEAGVERRGLFEAEKLTKNLSGGPVRPFPTVVDDTTDASDHGAVWAEFDL